MSLTKEQSDFVLELLQLLDEYDHHGSIWWRTDEEYAPVTFLLNCNDLFHWGCADCETLTPENLPRLRQALEDAKNACDLGEMWGDSLFVARERKMRPQTPVLKDVPKELLPLFEACGPERN